MYYTVYCRYEHSFGPRGEASPSLLFLIFSGFYAYICRYADRTFPHGLGKNGEQGHFIKSNVLKDAPETAPVPQAPSWRAGPVRVLVLALVLSKGDIYKGPHSARSAARIRPVSSLGVYPRVGLVVGITAVGT